MLKLVDPYHILKRTGDKEILLGQPELLAGGGLIIGIEHLGDGLGDDLLLDRAIVVAPVEGLKIEGFRGLRFPEAKEIDHRSIVSRYGGIIGNALDDPVRNPPYPPLPFSSS